MDYEKTFFQAILDNAPLGIWFLGLDGRLQFVNKTFCAATGIPEERFLAARHYLEVLPPEITANCRPMSSSCFCSQRVSSCARFRSSDSFRRVVVASSVLKSAVSVYSSSCR